MSVLPTIVEHKTFTQADVDRIVNDAVAHQKAICCTEIERIVKDKVEELRQQKYDFDYTILAKDREIENLKNKEKSNIESIANLSRTLSQLSDFIAKRR